MNQSSLKKNFAYKGLLTIANPIMGIITFPYISRVLGVENVGLINFVDNTISYFLLFATMGISSIGVRAIAATRDSQDTLNKTYSNLFGLNMIFTFAVLLVYNVIIFSVPRFAQYEELFLIGNAKILFTSLLIEWFFNGIENFKYITIRTLLIRATYIVMVFLMIRDADDYLLYFVLTTSVVIINAIVNQVYSRKFVRLRYSELASAKFLKENIMLGVYTIMTSMYLTFNVMYLGLVTNNVEVGYYTSAFKLYYLILSVFSAFTSVMLPRMSSLIAKGDHNQFSKLIDKSLAFVSLFSFPIVICGCILSPELIDLLCGKGYEGAILPMRIIMPAIIFVGMAQVLAIQILMPMKKDRILLGASVIGAVLSLSLNITLAPKLQSVGSAIVLISSEIVVTMVYICYVLREKMIQIPWKKFIQPILTSIPCALICLCAQFYMDSSFSILIVSVPAAMILYFLLNINNIKSYLLTKNQNR